MTSKKLLQTLPATLLLLSATAFGQSDRALEQVALRPAKPGAQFATTGILPDGHVEFRNATLRMMIAPAWNLNENRVTGGPESVDSDRYDLVAVAKAGTSHEDLLLMVQRLLTGKFKLVIHHAPRPRVFYGLMLAKGGPALQATKSPGSPSCPNVQGGPRQLHYLCHAFRISDLIEFLPQVAPNYIDRPIVNWTGLDGAYDFQLDWMGRAQFDAAAVSQAAGAPKDPLAVSIFDAVAKLGLALEAVEDTEDTIVIDGAQRLSAAGVVQSPALSLPALKPEEIDSIGRYVTAEMEREHIPGLALGIYNRGRILYARGYGMANVELKVPVKPETIFQSGSVGKQFVSAAVMMLVEEGKISLGDSIVKYFPNAPESWKPILIKNLLSHTSGLAEYETPDRSGPKGEFYLRLDFSEDELVQKVQALPIEFAPGDRWNYRNTNYLLLGIMVHQVTGMHYSDYLQESIFKPWQMTATRLISDSDIIPNRSSGYQWRGRLQNQDWVSPTFNSTADGTLYYNVLDLAKWDEALYGVSLLKQSSLDRIWTVFPLNDGKPNPAGYGFGWGIHEVNGHKLIEHGGAWQGFTCGISRYVDDNLTIVVLTNLAGSRPNLLMETVAGMLNPALKPPPPKEHKEVAVNPKVFDGYVGKYQLTPESVLTVTRQGDHLFAQLTNQPMFTLFPESEKDFFLKVVDAGITFVTDDHGRATELILHQRGDQHAKRIE